MEPEETMATDTVMCPECKASVMQQEGDTMVCNACGHSEPATMPAPVPEEDAS